MKERYFTSKLAAAPSILIWLACAAGAVQPTATLAQGTAFNPSGDDPTLERAANGMSLLIPQPSRTPGGFLYAAPYEMPQSHPLAGDWSYRLSAEAGAVARGSGNAPRLRNYADYRDGATLNYFNLGLDRPTTADYFDFTAGAVGREDQHYRVSVGRYGDFRTSFYFNQHPTLFTDRARTIFQGAGSGVLTLPAGLVPGNNTPAQIAAALQAASPFALGFTRKKSGVDFEATPTAQLRFHASYTRDQKNGTRPFGGAASFPGVTVVETIETIDYKTHNVAAGMQWAGEKFQANLSYAGSFFRNAIDTLTWNYPLAVDPPFLQRGRTDLYPDNNLHNLKLDVGTALPLRGRLTGGVSLTRMTQNDDLIAPTVNSGVVGGVDLANWNTTGALSQRTAGARIDTRLLHLGASFVPVQDLNLQVKVRHYDEDNRTRYTAFNPLTGQFGYLGLDGGNGNIVPAFTRVQIQSVPFEQRKDNYSAEADYRLLRRTNVTFGYEREDIRAPYREYARTQEDRIRAGLNNRDLPWATIRLSYEHADRRGDHYGFNPNATFYSSASLINTPATLADLRKYDVADRRQQIVNARVNFAVARDMDLAVSGRYLDNEYGAAYGRLAERIQVVNLEWNWQPSPKTLAYAYYGWERLRNRMASISDDPAGWATGDPNAGGAAYPFANRWDEQSKDDAHLVGLGFRYAFAQAILESNYTWLYSPYRTRYSFASSGAIAGGATVATGAGDGMPDIVSRLQTLETSLKIRLGKDTALRLYHRYERAKFKDWHYDGLPLVLGNGEGVFLGAGPRDYAGNLFGVFFQYTPGRKDGTKP
jgi:MtrB/PioB family decaheme-associated outer membrane protein